VGVKTTTPAKVLKVAVDKFVQLTSEVWKGFNRDARLYGASGDDSPPCKGDQTILVKIDGAGKYVAAGTLTVSRGAKPGEKIFYARDADAKIASKIAMLNDGSVKLEADGDADVVSKGAIATQSEGDTAFNSKKNMTTEAAEKNTVKGKDVEVNGDVKISGGSLECDGKASPTGTGCWCASRRRRKRENVVALPVGDNGAAHDDEKH
jgi:hypothetical protein